MKKKETIIKNLVICLNIVLFYYLLFVGRNQYLYNMSYLKCIVFIGINSMVIYFYGVLENHPKTYNSNIIMYTVLYSYLLFTFAFIISRPEFRFYNWWYSGQYKPFHTIISQLQRGSTHSILKNIVGNSIMLMPLSLLLMIKNKKFNNIFYQSMIIIPVIITIEILQAFTHTGAFDIDDLILNYMGTLIFTLIITRFHIIDKIRNLFYTDYNLNNKTKKILFYSSIFILIILDITFLMK